MIDSIQVVRRGKVAPGQLSITCAAGAAIRPRILGRGRTHAAETAEDKKAAREELRL